MSLTQNTTDNSSFCQDEVCAVLQYQNTSELFAHNTSGLISESLAETGLITPISHKMGTNPHNTKNLVPQTMRCAWLGCGGLSPLDAMSAGIQTIII